MKDRGTTIQPTARYMSARFVRLLKSEMTPFGGAMAGIFDRTSLAMGNKSLIAVVESATCNFAIIQKCKEQIS